MANNGVCFIFYLYKSIHSDLYSQGSLIDFSFDRTEESPLEAFEDIFATFENKK